MLALVIAIGAKGPSGFGSLLFEAVVREIDFVGRCGIVAG
jgi:hypothetical protein